MSTYRLTLSYDGTRWQGWHRQGNTENTIQKKLEDTLSQILDQPVEVAGSGRTDAGVHARMQTASFRAETSMSVDAILRELRAYLPEDIGAESLEIAPPRFHARLNCKGKTYLYRVWNSDAPCVFERRFVARFPEPLDLDAMQKAAKYLEGTHDFAAFHTGRGKKSTVRRIDSIEILRESEEVRLFFTGDGFLYNMARILAGTLLEVGVGRMAPDDIPAILESGDRKLAGPTAPAKGLILWKTYY
jgi:tRNA pseudouridine38-40 synthase